jgi:hypothetical protein
VVAKTNKKRATAHEVDRILLVTKAQIAGLFERQPGGKAGFGVACPWGISSHRSKQSAILFKLGLQLLGGLLVPLDGPLLPSDLERCHDGEVVREILGGQA